MEPEAQQQVSAPEAPITIEGQKPADPDEDIDLLDDPFAMGDGEMLDDPLSQLDPGSAVTQAMPGDLPAAPGELFAFLAIYADPC